MPLPPAEAVVQSLLLPETANHFYSLCSREGEGPGADSAKWATLFRACYPSMAMAGV